LGYYDQSLADLISTEQLDLGLDLCLPLNWMGSLMDWDLNQMSRERNGVSYYERRWVDLISTEQSGLCLDYSLGLD